MQSLNGTIKPVIRKPKSYCFEIDFRHIFLLSIATTTGMNMSVEKQSNANVRRKSIPKEYILGLLIIVLIVPLSTDAVPKKEVRERTS